MYILVYLQSNSEYLRLNLSMDDNEDTHPPPNKKQQIFLHIDMNMFNEKNRNISASKISSFASVRNQKGYERIPSSVRESWYV